MMTPDVPAPVADPKPPRRKAPPGSCDCHFHVFGPAEKYPYSPARGYTPPDAPLEAFERVMALLGMDRAVIVHPSVYGTDNRCSLDALAALGARARGVAVIDADTDDATLERMHETGVRGARFNLVSAGALPTDIMETIARRLADRGWHMQIYADGPTLSELEERLRAFPVDLVVDHIGQADPSQGIDQPGFRALLRLVDAGRCWVKLSGAYRIDEGPAPWPGAAPFAKKLLEAAPERMVWGTDWPHPDVKGPMPDDGDLFDALLDWIPGEAILRKVLVENPASLYGFDRTI